MKNFIPLILAVLLGLAAVLAVGRLLSARKEAAEKTIPVVAAARAIEEKQVITADMIMRKEVPVSAAPVQAISWTRSDMIIGQKALRGISETDYVLLSDVGLSRSMANIVGEGEWAVSMSMPASGVAKIVQPGDEVAIIGTFRISTKVESADLSAPEQVVEKDATLVLFPRVRVLDIGGKSAGGGVATEGNEIIVSLPPQQAQVLIAAQRKAQLTLALRRPGDEGTINRLDAGMVDEETFDKLLSGLESVKVPSVPGTLTTPAATTP